MMPRTQIRSFAFLLSFLLIGSFSSAAGHNHAKPAADNSNCVVCTFAHTPVEAVQASTLNLSFLSISPLQARTESFDLIRLIFRESARAPPSA